MSFIFCCPHCQGRSQAQDEWLGLSTKCPHCKNQVTIQAKKPSFLKRLFGSSNHAVIEPRGKQLSDRANINESASTTDANGTRYEANKDDVDKAASWILARYQGNVKFIGCVCARCGVMNESIMVPPMGRHIPYYGQKDNHGAFAIPVNCETCNEIYFVAWDEDPR